MIPKVLVAVVQVEQSVFLLRLSLLSLWIWLLHYWNVVRVAVARAFSVRLCLLVAFGLGHSLASSFLLFAV